MDKTLHDLGGIVLEGLPTLFLILILAFFVRVLYLKPLEKVLAERSRLTEGARKAAEESLQHAGSKIAEYETKLNEARAEIYREQAKFLERVHADEAARSQAVRTETETMIARAKQAVADESAAAREKLAAQSDLLAAQIADSILKGQAA